MVGATFIHAADPAILKADDVLERLERFDHVSLDHLLTLDFEAMLAGSGMSWSEGEPVEFDEHEGIAIFQVSPKSLLRVLDEPHGADAERAADLAKLRSFVSAHGAQNIYELATF
jgi:hypothetical protein